MSKLVRCSTCNTSLPSYWFIAARCVPCHSARVLRMRRCYWRGLLSAAEFRHLAAGKERGKASD